jgi:hypothetical protein
MKQTGEKYPSLLCIKKVSENFPWEIIEPGYAIFHGAGGRPPI